jgi:hypothetical protein
MEGSGRWIGEELSEDLRVARLEGRGRGGRIPDRPEAGPREAAARAKPFGARGKRPVSQGKHAEW